MLQGTLRRVVQKLKKNAVLNPVGHLAETRLTYNCAHLMSTKESLTIWVNIFWVKFFWVEIFWVKIFGVKIFGLLIFWVVNFLGENF